MNNEIDGPYSEAIRVATLMLDPENCPPQYGMNEGWRLFSDALASARARAQHGEACRHGWRGAAPERGERIVTPCPSCGSRSLFIGTGGHLTCAVVPHGDSLGCPNPSVEDAIMKLKGCSPTPPPSPQGREEPTAKAMTEAEVHAALDEWMEFKESARAALKEIDHE